MRGVLIGADWDPEGKRGAAKDINCWRTEKLETARPQHAE
jgi:hypothetical protein